MDIHQIYSKPLNQGGSGVYSGSKFQNGGLVVYSGSRIQNGGLIFDKIIPKIKDEFDLVFIDADKENYSNYFKIVIEKMPIGGFIIADNVLWSGKVVEEVNDKDQETKALKEFNTLIHTSERVENILMPIRDGLMICQKIK